MLSPDDVSRKVQALKRRYADRDARNQDVRDVRAGDVSNVLPGMFPDDWPRPIIANFVDITARDLAEVIAPLPSVNCSAGHMVSERAKKFTAKRTKIAHWYVQQSNLSTEMFSGADRYLTYGQLPLCVYPDFENKVPRICLEDPFGAYAEHDMRGRCTVFARSWRESAHDLAARYPEYATRILPRDYAIDQDTQLEVVKFYDDDQMLVLIPERDNLVLFRVENFLGRCPVVVAERPGLVENDHRGQWDDVIWIQLARARMALLGLEAAEKSVQAPLALPSDVQEMAFGGDALLRSATPEKIRRVGLELPQGAFAEGQLLMEEMRLGARYPEGRSGQIDSSVVTGRGVQALLGGFDTQVKTAQEILGRALGKALEMCFELDEKIWPNTKKEIRGTSNGTPFEETYTPARDISGSYMVDISYGFAAGMDPNRALVFLLQLRGDKLVPRDLVQRQLPMDLDIVQLQQQIDIEETNDALKQGLFSMLGAMGVLAQSGQDPVVLLHQAASVIAAREKGQPLHEAILTAFTPQTPPGSQTPGAEPGLPGSESGPGGMPPTGLPPGTAVGQAGMGPGGAPDIQTLLAGLTGGGQPNMRASVQRRLPA